MEIVSRTHSQRALDRAPTTMVPVVPPTVIKSQSTIVLNAPVQKTPNAIRWQKRQYPIQKMEHGYMGQIIVTIHYQHWRN